MLEALGFVLGVFLLVGVVLGVVYQLTWREPVAPGFLDEFEMMNLEYEPERPFEERLAEAKAKLVDTK